MKHLVIIPIEGNFSHTADFLRQTALTLAKRNQVYIYDQVNSYFFLKKSKELHYPQHKNITFYQVKYWLPLRRVPWIEKLNRKLSWWLFLLKFSQQKKLLWFFYPNYFDLATIKTPHAISLYDCVDYQEESAKEQEMIKNVDYFFVNSNSLAQLHHEQDKRPILLNAQGFFTPQTKTINQTHYKFDKPVVGFVGGINYRLNFPILEKLISRSPQWQFIFYGPEQFDQKNDQKYKTSFWINKIKNHKNVLFASSQNRYKVYGIIKQFDVALIPYNTQIIFNRICYPMKLFEYFYFGKPVVSSPIQELMLPKFEDLVYIANNVDEWEQHIETLLSTSWSSDKIAKQKMMAVDNSWSRKVKAICDIVSPN